LKGCQVFNFGDIGKLTEF